MMVAKSAASVVVVAAAGLGLAGCGSSSTASSGGSTSGARPSTSASTSGSTSSAAPSVASLAAAVKSQEPDGKQSEYLCIAKVMLHSGEPQSVLQGMIKGSPAQDKLASPTSVWLNGQNRKPIEKCVGG